MGRPDANSGPSQGGGRRQQPQEHHFQPATQSPETIDDAPPPPFETSIDDNQQENSEENDPPKRVENAHQNQRVQSRPTPSRGPMAFPPQNTQMRSPPSGHQPQAFPPSQDEPQAFPPASQDRPQAFPPSQDEPQAFPPASQDRPQAFPPPQEETQAFPPPQDQPQAFPPPQDHQAQAFPPSQGQPQAFPPPQDQPQAFPPSQDHQAQAFPPPQDHQAQAFPSSQGQPQAFPPPQDQPQAFPPSQEHQAQAFPPPQDNQAQAFPPPQGQPPAFPAQQHAFQAHFSPAANFPQPAMGVGGQIPIPQAMSSSPLVHPNAPVTNTGIPMAQVLPTQAWKTSLFGCMDDPTNALITACFPCVTFGQIAEVVDSGQTSCGTSGMLYGLIACLIAVPCLLSCTYRTKIRGRYGLMESPAPDWIIHCFCECCALCQEYRELQKRGLDPSIGWLGNVARNQQMAQLGAMTPPMRQTMMG